VFHEKCKRDNYSATPNNQTLIRIVKSEQRLEILVFDWIMILLFRNVTSQCNIAIILGFTCISSIQHFISFSFYVSFAYLITALNSRDSSSVLHFTLLSSFLDSLAESNSAEFSARSIERL